MGRGNHLLRQVLSALALWNGVLGFSEFSAAQNPIPTCTTCNPVEISDKVIQNKIRQIHNDAAEAIKPLRLQHAAKLKLVQDVQSLLDRETAQLETLNKTDWKAVGLFSLEVGMGVLDIYKFGEGGKVRAVICSSKNLTPIQAIFHYKSAAEMAKFGPNPLQLLTTNLVKNFVGVKLSEKIVKMTLVRIQEGGWTERLKREAVGLIPVAGPFWRAGNIADEQIFDKWHAAVALTESINAKAQVIEQISGEAKNIIAKIQAIKRWEQEAINALKSNYLKNERPKISQCKPKKR